MLLPFRSPDRATRPVWASHSAIAGSPGYALAPSAPPGCVVADRATERVIESAGSGLMIPFDVRADKAARREERATAGLLDG